MTSYALYILPPTSKLSAILSVLPETLEFGSNTLYQYATGSVCQSLTAQPMKAIQHIASTNLNSVKKLHRIKNDWYANFSQWTNLKLILSYSTYQLAVHNIIFG